MGKCISTAQAGFVPGKRTAENVIIAKEVTAMMGQNRRKKKFCAPKLDIHKAYDTVSWPFLETCLNQMGFPQAFVQLLMSCVSTVTY